jgi:hypothetical protein
VASGKVVGDPGVLDAYALSLVDSAEQIRWGASRLTVALDALARSGSEFLGPLGDHGGAVGQVGSGLLLLAERVRSIAKAFRAADSGKLGVAKVVVTPGVVPNLLAFKPGGSSYSGGGKPDVVVSSGSVPGVVPGSGKSAPGPSVINKGLDAAVLQARNSYQPFWVTGSSNEVRLRFEQMALKAAGITDWVPLRGVGAKADRENVERVYRYYGDLYLSDPQRYLWAGMAALIGPSFYAGFQDLETFTHAMYAYESIAALSGGTIPKMPTDFLAVEFKWYETLFLRMQKEIFFDMATAHEAYRVGGMAAIRKIYENDIHNFAQGTIDAWQQIDDGMKTGNRALVESGNKTLLEREQRYVIEKSYKAMLQRPVSGTAVTYMLTAVGSPSIPGAKSYPEVFPGIGSPCVFRVSSSTPPWLL